jgi:hypothetical protein
MKINSFKKRAFFKQTGNFSFLAELTFPSTKTDFEIGFSGDTTLPFYFKKGKIIDRNGYFLGSYNAQELVSFSGNFSTTGIDYFINNDPKAFNINRPTGNLDYFYINPSEEFDIDIYIKGVKPSYSFTNSVNYNTGDSVIPINLTNNSNTPFKIFSGEFLGDNNLFNLSGFPTGLITGTKTFYFNQNNVGGANNLTVLMNTDFGQEIFNIQASGVIITPESYSIQLVGPLNIDAGDTGVYYCLFYNDSGQMTVQPTLNFISGSGNIFAETQVSGLYSTTLTGNITKSGILSKSLEIPATGNQVTGLLNYFAEEIVYATGNFSWNYSIPSSGIVSVGAYNGLGTGLITGTIVGTTSSNGGFYNYSGFVYGAPTFSYTSNPTGYTTATGLIDFNTPVNNDFLYVGNSSMAIVYGFHYSDVTGLTNYLNTNQSIHKVSATNDGVDVFLTSNILGSSGNLPVFVDINNQGNMSVISLTGGSNLGIGALANPIGQFTGFLNQEFNGTGFYSLVKSGLATSIYTGIESVKSFTGTWDLLTGKTIDNLISSKSNGEFNSTTFSGQPYSKNIGSFYIYLPYNNNSSIADIVDLTITGVGLPTGITFRITGNI